MTHSRLLLCLLACAAPAASAHHSYAMFDSEHVTSVTGSVAKLDWANPHVFVWVYVPSTTAASGYDLYAFENGSTNVLRQRGWSKELVAAGDKVVVEYWPLRDGRKGGHLKALTLPDGRVIQGAGGPRGVDGAASPYRDKAVP